ncbi:MAG TPA: hypothetical protein VK186_22755 [Candidatus Deferrimicrobium sp.]|nr:hypothetical protein [Candidatus Deferrimicrobium sp.]
MKKNRTLILLSILILTLLVGILIPAIVEAAKDPLPSPSATGHLLWDNIDKVWRCVGSPIDCA